MKGAGTPCHWLGIPAKDRFSWHCFKQHRVKVGAYVLIRNGEARVTEPQLA